MNENIDLTKILKNCPRGWKFYSLIYGEVEFDTIINNDTYPIIFITNRNGPISVTSNGKHVKLFDGECILFPSKDQRDWSKFTAPWYNNEESIKPKFKVGDKIRHKETNKNAVYEISKVYDDSYGIAGFTWVLYMKYQDQYELVPNKFDPKTLKPFDKVLVKNDDDITWVAALFSHIIEFHDEVTGNDYLESVTSYCTSSFCIPYNDDTKHLVGTEDEAPEFYNYWED